MKIRNGFVSNSSSASFVVYWRKLDFENKEYDVKQLVGEGSEVSDAILRYTQKTASEGAYKTTGFTAMYNDIDDVPPHLAYLVMALKLVNGYELIDVSVDGEGGW